MAHILIESALTRSSGRYFPGISYIPDQIEVAEDKDLMAKLYLEFVDFLQCTTDLLDLMHYLKNRNLKSAYTIPHSVVREMIVLGDKGRLYRDFDRKSRDVSAGVSSSLESVLRHGATPTKQRTTFLPILHKPEATHTPGRFFTSLQADLMEITGKRTKPLWHSVAMEHEDFLAPKMAENPTKSDISVENMTYPCRHPGKDIKRSPSEILQFSLKFCLQAQLPMSNPRFRRQMDMMLASRAGFASVEAHKAYMATKRAQWYRDFVQETVKLGLLSCHEVVRAFERLGKHYDMTRDSLPFAKAKLCLLVMSLPFWDVARVHTQRAVEFILERILYIKPEEEQPLRDWLKARRVPYVVTRPLTADDFMKQYSMTNGEPNAEPSAANVTSAHKDLGNTGSSDPTTPKE